MSPAVAAPASTLLKPYPLRPGARIAVVSPASAAKPDRIHDGIAALRSLGYDPVLSPHALGSGPLYFSGTVDERLADLHAAFADPSIDAICCTRGGWGSAELLPHLDLDLIRANPKPFLGYSDHTSLHTWIGQQTNLVTFYAPMVSPDFARGTTSSPLDGIDLPSFHAALSSTDPWQLGPASGLRLLRRALNGDTSVDGPLWGGCLAILAEALGTPFAPQPRPGSILFLEDVNTRPYQWDRMLLHLRFAGLLEGVRAIVFGDMHQCVQPEENSLLEAALLHNLRDFPGPIAIGLQSGHVNTPNITLPLGVRVGLQISADQVSLQFLEPAVAPTPESNT